MAIVIFDKDDWIDAYPQFKGQVTEGQLKQAFDIACMILDNTDNSPIPYDPEKGIETRKIMLWLLLCHLVALALRPVNQGGTLTSATEGSVSTGFSLPTSVNGQYFMQTPCGQTFWELLRKFSIGGRYYDLKRFHPWG